MADIESNIDINIDTSNALAGLRALQREISTFHQSMAKTGAVSNGKLADMQQNLINGINATGQFSASMQTVKTTTESFTSALEKNKLSMGQYFRYAGSQVGGFRKLFSTEFDTIEKVARERVKTLQTQYIKLGRDASGAMKAISVRPTVLDMDDLGTKTAVATQKAQIFNQLMRQGSTELLNFGKNTQWAGRQLMVGFTIPLGIMGAAAAREFMKMEEQVIRLQRVYGDFSTSASETDAMAESVKNLGIEFTKYGVAVEKTIGLAADAAAMGKTGVDLVAQVTEATRLAVLGGVEQNQALETTISLQNAFGISSDKLAGKINFLNAVENQTATSIEDLTEAIPKAGPVVQQLGGSVEDLAFFMTAMKEGGIDAGEGANALKSGLASIINPTQEAIDQLNGFGISIESIRNANAGNVTGMIKGLATELDGLTDMNRAQAIETMFGKFQFARMSTLFQNVIAEGSQASRVLDLTKNSATELAMLSERELARVEASPMYKFQAAVESFKASLAPVGEEFLKAVTPLINFGTDVLNKFNEMSDGGKQFAVIITGVVAGIGPVLLMTFGLIANGVANLIKGFMFVRGVLNGTGKSSNVLAEQLNYMTTEQLEAAAVASSLGQVHTNLIQTFNAEAGAVRNLAAAYGSAIGVQGQFMGPIVSGGGTKKPRKMATGGSVPGRGNGDTVPAMLTPGEFVLTKDVAKKYPGLISAMMSGDIKGFSEGGEVEAQSGSAVRGSRGRATIAQSVQKITDLGYESDAKALLARLTALGIKVEGTAGTTSRLLSDMRMAAEQGPEILEDYLSRLNKTLDDYTDLALSDSKKILEGTRKGVDLKTGEVDAEAVAKARAINPSLGQAERGAFTHIGSGASMSPNQFKEKYPSLYEGLDSRSRSELERQLINNPQDESKVSIKSGLAMTGLSQGLNDRLARAGESVDSFLGEFDTAGVSKWNQSIEIGGGNVEELSGAASDLDKQFRNVVASSGAEVVFDSRAQADAHNAKGGSRAISVEEAYATARANADAELVKALDTAQTTATGVRVAGAQSTTESKKRIRGGLGKSELDDELKQVAENENAVSVEKTTAVVKKKAEKAADVVVDGVVSAIADGRDDVVAEQKKTTTAQAEAAKNKNPAFGKVASGVTAPTVVSPAAIKNLVDKMPKIIPQVPNLRDAQMGAYGGTNILKGKELQFARGAKLLDSAQMLKPINMLNAAMKTTATGIKTASIAVKDFGIKTATTVKTFSNNMISSMKQLAVSAKQTASSVGQSAKQMALSAGGKIKGFATSGKLGMMGMAASSGLMMASGQEGPLGDVARTISGPMMAISSIGSVLSMIPGPAGLVVAGLAAVAAGVIAYNVAIDNGRKAGAELADAMSMTASKMNNLSEITGKQSISAMARKEREDRLAGIAKGASTQDNSEMAQFKEGFKGSEFGKQFIEDLQTQLKNKKPVSEIASNMSTQLSAAIAEGVLSKEQADAVAEVLGESIKNKEFTVKLKGELSAVTGMEQTPGALAESVTAKSAEEAKKTGKYASDNLQNQSINDKTGVGAGLVAGGAVTMLAAGWTGIGAIVGLGAVAAGVAMQLWGAAEAGAENAKNATLAADMYSQAYTQNLAMTDVIKQQYATAIANKQAQLDMATTDEERLRINGEINALQESQTGALQRQKQSATALIANAEKTKYNVGQDNWDTAQKEQIKTTYEGDATMQTMATEQYNRASAEGAQGIDNTTTQTMLEIQIASGALDPGTAETLLNAMVGNETLQASYTLLFEKVGDQAAMDMVSSLTAAGADDKTLEQAINFAANIENPEEAKAFAEEMANISALASQLNSMGIEIDINDKGARKRLRDIQDSLATVDALFESTSPVTADIIMNQYGLEMSQEAMDYFNSLPPEDQKTYTQAYLTVYKSIDANTDEGKAELRAWSVESGHGKGKANKYYDAGNKIAGAKYDYAKMAQDYAAQQATAAVSTSQANRGPGGPGPATVDNGSGSSGGGGGGGSSQPEKAPTSFLDSIVKSLRDVRVGAQKMTENFADSWAAINGMFGSGRGMNVFSGIQQQMRSLGAGEDLINLIAGMSPEEFEQRKNDLFTFDGAGNISGFKDMLSSIGAAMRAIALGEFQNKQQSALKTANDQNTAVRKLVAAGYSYADAFKLAEDAAVAHAIANENDAAAIAQVTAAATAATKAVAALNAAQSVAGTNQNVTNQAATLSFLEQYSANLTDAQQAAILASDDLSYLAANFNTLTPEQLRVFQEALRNADLQADVDIRVSSQTIEGMEKLFSQGLSKAMEAFAAQEKAIGIKFELLEDPFKKAMEAFEDKIEDLRNAPGGLDDLEADLQRISDQEIDINKKYKDRTDALNEIEKSNQRIQAQQRTQLSVADALSRGDIAAAARAAAELNAQQAEQAAQDQREALQRSQDLEISKLTGTMGLTREQIEARVRDIKNQILEIEERGIEPARRQVELLERQRQLEVDSLEVLGRKKSEWEAIENQIAIAKTTSESYTAEMELALSKVAGILEYWNDLDGKEVSTIHTIIERKVQENTPAPTPVATPVAAPAAPSGPVKDQAWIDSMAVRVIRGEFGNGQTRRDQLGGDYQMIQDRVNQHYYGGARLFNRGGLVARYMATGGLTKPMFAPKGTDTVPAMLTPGEFVVKKWAVDNFGVGNLQAINSGKYRDGSVYNNTYSISVNVKSESNPDQIARTVMAQIKQVDAQRIRGNRF